MDSVSLFKDPVVTCPYDKYHRIALSKIQMHIVKCEKNFPAGYKETCPFNATHRVFKHELQEHVRNCPQRTLLEPEIYERVENHGSLMSDFIAESITESIVGDNRESWDTEFGENSGASAANSNSLHSNPSNSDHIICDDPGITIRRPLGYSEAMMVAEESDAPEISDIESVVSYMGVGRGKINKNNIELYKRLNFGRGRCPNMNQ